MSIFETLNYVPRFNVLLFLLLLGLPFAHASAASGIDLSAARADLIANLTDLANGNDAAAIARFEHSIPWGRGSIGYEYHLGANLATAAFMLYDAGNVPAASRVAKLALSHLDVNAQSLTGAPSSLLGQADETAGLLEERVLGDLLAAQKCYARAISRSGKRPTATSGVARIAARLSLAR